MSPLQLPPEDRRLSPLTGWTREHWAAIADQLLLSLRPYFSAGRARVLPPGRRSAYGADSDGLEGFARSFLLAGFRIVGESGRDPHGFLDWYRAGLIEGTDPSSPERWPRPDELGQAKVEAASIALILQLTRPWLWDTLTAHEQQNVIGWLATVIGEEYPQINWVWFQIVVETFLASVGAAHEPGDIAAGLAVHEALARAHGWYSDGPERAYDYYCGWAMHFYPLVWAHLGGSRFGADALAPAWRERLADFLDDYVHLIGPDGPLLQGRSLIYRFAAATPLWVGAATGTTRLEPGLLRRAASGILRSFVARGVPDEHGLLTLGLFRSWPDMAQSYSGSGSPYWAAKGMFGLALPAQHPVWTSVEQPLPVEQGDTRRFLTAPGWIVSGTQNDGIVRVLNHGTDHAALGDDRTDSPLYARLGYSTATIPPLKPDSTATDSSATDSSVGVLDGAGRLSHRTGFRVLGGSDDGVAAHAASVAHAHWVTVSPDAGPDHGSGRSGTVTWGPTIAIVSAIRGSWEVRAALLDDTHRTWPLRFCGWPLASDTEPDVTVQSDDCSVDAAVGDLHSQLRMLSPRHAQAGTTRADDVSPLGPVTVVPHLTVPGVAAGEPVVVAVRLGHCGAPAPRVRVQSHTLTITWPDGPETVLTLPVPTVREDGVSREGTS